MNLNLLELEPTRDEGKQASVYKNSLGYWTIGIGKCVDSRAGCGLSEAAIRFLFSESVQEVADSLNESLPWRKELDDTRQRVLASQRVFE